MAGRVAGRAGRWQDGRYLTLAEGVLLGLGAAIVTVVLTRHRADEDQDGAGPSTATVQVPAASGDESYTRWQDRARSELAFVNNLLIGLASGLVAALLAAENDVIKARHLPPWQPLLTATGLIVLAMSLLAGVWLAANRLQSTRLTARLVRIRTLRDRVFDGDSRRRLALRTNIQGLDRPEHWTRPEIRKAARACTRSGNKLTRAEVDPVVAALREWTAGRADPRSWRLIRLQLWLFVAGGALIAAAPIWDYLRAA